MGSSFGNGPFGDSAYSSKEENIGYFSKSHFARSGSSVYPLVMREGKRSGKLHSLPGCLFYFRVRWICQRILLSQQLLLMVTVLSVLPHVRALRGGGENLPSEHPWEAALSRRQDVAWQRQTPTGGEVEMACSRAEGVHRGSFGGSLKTTRPYKAMDLPRKGSADGLICESSLPMIPVV